MALGCSLRSRSWLSWFVSCSGESVSSSMPRHEGFIQFFNLFGLVSLIFFPSFFSTLVCVCVCTYAQTYVHFSKTSLGQEQGADDKTIIKQKVGMIVRGDVE